MLESHGDRVEDAFMVASTAAVVHHSFGPMHNVSGGLNKRSTAHVNLCTHCACDKNGPTT